MARYARDVSWKFGTACKDLAGSRYGHADRGQPVVLPWTGTGVDEAHRALALTLAAADRRTTLQQEAEHGWVTELAANRRGYAKERE